MCNICAKIFVHKKQILRYFYGIFFTMESEVHQDKSLPSQGLKQVKVDNWGIFFLQRLQQLYAEEQLLDLKIKFPTSNIIVQVKLLSNNL